MAPVSRERRQAGGGREGELEEEREREGEEERGEIRERRRGWYPQGSECDLSYMVSDIDGYVMPPNFKMYLYRIQVSPAADDKYAIHRLIAVHCHCRHLPQYVCKESLLWTTRPIPDSDLMQISTLPNKPNVEYTITLQFDRIVDNTEDPVIKIYTSVLNRVRENALGIAATGPVVVVMG